MVLPHRPAVLAAKMLSTIDVLSGGRLTVGIGAGWLKEEFDAIGAPDFAERGGVSDEYIEAFRALWTQEAPAYSGKHVQFANIDFSPKPVQKPAPPIWIGGESGPAMRRAARLGDGWYPIGVNPQHPLDSLPRFRKAVARLRKLTEEAGRDAGAVALAYRVQRFGPALAPLADDGERRLFAGTPAEIVADLVALRSEGVGHVDVGFEGATIEVFLAAMENFKRSIIDVTI
jgi:probable F420-dependent oxidoreductase